MSQTEIPALYNTVKDEILKEIKDIVFFSAARYVVKLKYDPVRELDHTLHNCRLDPALKVSRDQIYS